MERRRKSSAAPGVASTTATVACGLESGRLEKGGSAANELRRGGSALARGEEEAEGWRNTGRGSHDHGGCVLARERRILPRARRRGIVRAARHRERQPRPWRQRRPHGDLGIICFAPRAVSRVCCCGMTK